MTNHFADYETSKMLKELTFDEPCLAHYRRTDNALIAISAGIAGVKYSWIENKLEILAPIWQQVEQWLWEKYLINVRAVDVDLKGKKGWGCQLGICGIRDVHTLFDKDVPIEYNESPITAKIEVIKKAVKWVYDLKQIELAAKN